VLAKSISTISLARPAPDPENRERLTPMTDNWTQFSLNGCLFETAPAKGPTLKVPQLRLPDRVDLRAHCSPVESQLETNSCVANAVVGALEFHQRKAGKPVTDLSRLFVYYNARALTQSENQDTGSYIHHGMAAILAHGACEERMWPFLEAMVTTRPTMGCFKNASQYEAVQYARTPLGVSALSALSQGLPVVFGTYAPMDYYTVANATGAMPHPTEIQHTAPPSGHAMLLVGYDQTERTYLARNSWGPNWSDGGYCNIPADTLEAWSNPTSFWTIGAIEQTEGFGLLGEQIQLPKTTMPAASLGKKVTLGEQRSKMGSDLQARLDKSKSNLRQRLGRTDKPD